MTMATTPPILEVDGLTRRAADGTALLDGVSFNVEAGWLVAVVGPTGAGKTSLAKALLGQLPLDAGTVRMRGQLGSRRVAGVPQDDATHAQLTLRRTLDHAAALRSGGTPSQRRHKVDGLLAELGLSGRASTPLSNLSGGERKRANVAVELLGDPDLLVLDEPTAGLDPAYERSVFASLRALADTGRTIVAITHSMHVLTVCDRVLFLAPGGTVAFYGPPDEAAAYFDWDDPADAYAALSTEPGAWSQRFSAHQASHPAPAPAPATIATIPTADAPSWRMSAVGTDPASRWHGAATSTPGAKPGFRTGAAVPAPEAAASSGHLGTLLRRSWHLASSDRRTLLIGLAAGPVLGLLLFAVLPGGALERGVGPDGQPLRPSGAAASFAFFLAMTITWLGAAAAAREVVKERHIVRRERLVGVSLSSYLTGKALFLSAATAVQVLPLTGLALIRQGTPVSGPALGAAVLEILVVAVVVGVAAVATGLLVSTWASTSEKAMAVLPVVLIAQLALAGPWAEGRSAGLAALRGLVPARWAAMAVDGTVAGDASRFWLGLAGVAGLAAFQLVAALLLLGHTAGSPATTGTGPFDGLTTRVASTSPGTARLLPVGIGVVVALAAGYGALRGGPSGPESPQAATLAVAAPPVAAMVTPTAAAAPPTTVTPTPPSSAPATTAAPARPAPVPTAPRATPTTSPRVTTSATTAPAPVPPAPPVTAAAAPASAPQPQAAPAATAAGPLEFTSWILQQVFQPFTPR